MEETNTVITKTEKGRRMCPACCKGQEHTINTIEHVSGRYTLTHKEEICDACGGKRIIADQKRGNYRLNG